MVKAVQSTQGADIPSREGEQRSATQAPCGADLLTAQTASQEYAEAISFDNLYKALKASCRNVRWKDSVVGYEQNTLRNTYSLRQDLLRGTYEIQPYQRFRIYEPKERDIVATRIRDRQYQHAITDNIIYRELTRSFIRDNVACQIGRGVSDCDKRMRRHLRKYYLQNGPEGWYLKCDIRHYFESIPHEAAKEAVRKRVRVKEAAEAACDIIDSFGGETGLGLGSQISQLAALAVLDDIDHYIKERLRVRYYIRYMDDFILIHPDKGYLKLCRERISEKLGGIGLALHAKKTMIAPLSQGIILLKWHYYLTRTGRIIVKMDCRKPAKQRKHLAKLYEREKARRAKPGVTKRSMDSWMSAAKRGNTYHIRRSMAGYYKQLTGEAYEFRKRDENQPDTGGEDCAA